MDDHDPLPYADSGTLRGQLQRGRGEGARRALRERAVDEVMACVRVDWRWDWQVDDRCGYLARLIRDLGIAIEPVVARLRGSADPNDWRDDSHQFHVAVGILELLALGGDAAARQALLDYIRDGEHWVDALESVALTWPSGEWSGLYPVAARRLTEADVEHLHLYGDPWKTWLAEHPAFAARCADRRAEAADRRNRRPRGEPPMDLLLAFIRDPERRQPARTRALFDLARRKVPLDFLDLVRSLTFRPEPDGPPWLLPGVLRVVQTLGAAAVGHARQWAEAEPPFSRLGLRVLARHGDRSDLPILAKAVEDMLRGTVADDWCGFDDLFDGMLRVGLADTTGSPLAKRTIDQLEYLWESTPHSRERDSYLRALIALHAADGPVVEGLWDCEDDVRLLAVTTAPLTSTVHHRLARLRDDPLETDEIREAAATRCG